MLKAVQIRSKNIILSAQFPVLFAVLHNMFLKFFNLISLFLYRRFMLHCQILVQLGVLSNVVLQ